MIAEADKSKIEFLSLGDYGRDKNVKADFLGLEDDIDGVPNGEIMSLKEKWVTTISTQYGCNMNCTFCDVPKVGKGLNATYNDLKNQIIEAIKIHPEIMSTKRLNIHFARMGEPTFNPNVLEVSYDLRKIVQPLLGRSLIHPVISTMLPKNNKLLIPFLQEWTNDIKNDLFRGDAGLQFSINSTNEEQRNEMFSNNSLSLKDVSEIGRGLPDPKGRKYALNFALADNYEVDARKLKKLFNPNKFMIKITPLHKTLSCEENSIVTTDGVGVIQNVNIKQLNESRIN